MVNSNRYASSTERRVSGNPTSKRRGPKGENQRTPKPVLWKSPRGSVPFPLASGRWLLWKKFSLSAKTLPMS